VDHSRSCVTARPAINDGAPEFQARDHRSSSLASELPSGHVTLSLGADDLAALRKILSAVAAGETTEHQPSNDDAAVLMAKIVLEARTMRSRVFPAAMFSEPAWEILLVLYLTAGQLAPSELARRTNVPPSTICRWLAYLEGHKLIAREACRHDRRARKVRLTDEASAKLHAIFAGVNVRHLSARKCGG
jgi:DNA-binding MarR family transcriptional regulator